MHRAPRSCPESFGDLDVSGILGAAEALFLLKRAVGQPRRARERRIDYPASLLYRAWALYPAPEVPEAYDGAGTVGEDDEHLLEVSHARGSLPETIEIQIAP
jgi:hypothetical protein